MLNPHLHRMSEEQRREKNALKAARIMWCIKGIERPGSFTAVDVMEKFALKKRAAQRLLTNARRTREVLSELEADR